MQVLSRAWGAMPSRTGAHPARRAPHPDAGHPPRVETPEAWAALVVPALQEHAR